LTLARHAEPAWRQHARLVVEDTGSGMDEATLGERTSLGLSVVHGIMKSYAGGISVACRSS